MECYYSDDLNPIGWSFADIVIWGQKTMLVKPLPDKEIFKPLDDAIKEKILNILMGNSDSQE